MLPFRFGSFVVIAATMVLLTQWAGRPATPAPPADDPAPVIDDGRAANAAVLARIQAKSAVTRELIAGRVSLADAGGRFRALDVEAGAVDRNLAAVRVHHRELADRPDGDVYAYIALAYAY